MSNDLTFGIKLTGDGKELRDELVQTNGEITKLTKTTDDFNKITSRAASSYSGLTLDIKEHSAAVTVTDGKVAKLLDRYDPLGAKLRQLQADFKALDRAAAGGKIAGGDDARVDQVYVNLQKEIAAASAATATFGKSAGAAGVSAGQLRMATQQLPMQFSDIWVSLVAGQNPMMVMMQQGTQIKDSFGGMGAAARGLGGYVMGLINPFTLAAAAAVAGGAAWYYWGREAESAADKAVAAADKIIAGMRSTDAVYLLQRERDKIGQKIPVQWLSYDDKQLAKLDADSQKLIAEYKKIDKQLKSEAERSTREWEGFHATDAQRKTAELGHAKQLYEEQVALAKGKTDKLLSLEQAYQSKVADINKSDEHDKKAVDAKLRFIAALTKEAETVGQTGAALKVYEAQKLGISGGSLELVKRLAAEVDAHKSAEQAIKNKAKAEAEAFKLEQSLNAERDALQAARGQNTLANPNMQGDARVEAERAIAAAAESSKYEMQVAALERESALMAQHGDLTAQNAAVQQSRMEVLRETHEQRMLNISLRYMTEKEKFDAMSWKRQVITVSGEMERMTQVSATKSRAMFEVNKIAARANATVKGMEAWQSAYASGAIWGGPVGGWAMRLIAMADTAATLAQINNTQFGGGGSTVASVGAGGGIPSLSTSPGTPVTQTGANTSTPEVQRVSTLNLSIAGAAQNPNIAALTYNDFINTIVPFIQEAKDNGYLVDLNVTAA